MKISVVTASYNYQDYIKEAVQSVLDQTYKDWELIIVDDCSTDNSVEVIKSFKDERIKLFINEKNLGLKETVKRGIENATGEWVVFLESDDILTPDYIEKKVEIAKKYTDINLIFNDCEFFGDENKVNDFNLALKKTRIILSKKNYPQNLFYNVFQSNKIFTFSCVMVKKDNLQNIDYNPKLDYLLDWHLWIQIAYTGKFYYIDKKFTKWRLHRKSYINQSKYCTPFDLQLPCYLLIFKQALDLKILFFIVVALPVWYLRELKRNIIHIKLIP